MVVSSPRRPKVVLINGLAEQGPTWCRNVAAWEPFFDLHQPSLVSYDDLSLSARMDVPTLVARLRGSLNDDPCHLVANSLGGKIAVTFAVQYPRLVRKLVLLCPAGLGGEERLPVIEGVRRGNARGLVESVFHTIPGEMAWLVDYHQKRLADRGWRRGLVRTVQGTKNHCVRDLLPWITQPTLLVVGREDRIVDPEQAIGAASLLRHGELHVLPNCGHAPQIERPELVNRLVIDFLQRE